jgi:hypothetical protein
MVRIGEDVAEKLNCVPGAFTVERHIRDAAHSTQMLHDVRAGPQGCRGNQCAPQISIDPGNF